MQRRELPVSTTVGDAYRLGRRIGDGALGAVYEAIELRHQRPCALKVISAATAQGSETLARYYSQAETASRLVHPHLVGIYDFGTLPSGEPFLLMEPLVGEDLARRLRRTGRLEAPLVSHVVLQIASGLAALHEEGLAHLAVKPTNVFLVDRQAEGEPPAVKVLDFATAEIDSGRPLAHPSMLQDTLPYLAPEQARRSAARARVDDGTGERLDHRADQWALACLAWEMLLGRPPFFSDDPTALLYQITYEDPQPGSDLNIEIPPGVMEVLGRALDKRRDARFPDIVAFARAFEAMAGTLAVRQPFGEPAHHHPTAGFANRPGSLAPPGFAPDGPPVFAPSGMSMFDALAAQPHEPPRGSVWDSIRAAPAPMVMSAGPSQPAGPPAPPPTVPAAATSPLLTPRRRQILAVASVPAMMVVGLLVNWARTPRRSIDVERTPAPELVGSPAPATPAGPGPTIVPLPTPPPPVPPSARGRRALLRAKRAARRAKLRAASKVPRSPTRRP